LIYTEVSLATHSAFSDLGVQALKTQGFTQVPVHANYNTMKITTHP